MEWVVESSPATVTRQTEKWQLCGSPAAVTRQRGAGWRWGAHVRELHPQVRAARRGSSSNLVRSQEVATRLPADRPLHDDGLFVDQSEMIYSMDSRSFYRESCFTQWICDPFIANRSAILVTMLHESC
ncbi:unnamed protein product [Spirodela intermedia]|uniref:Uncharacterized protein n=1 Tax=Spirodela intermedia TaxID=51605 RepID=A0A7I8KJF2_SPIIN|nr:unnamed protein product [Spirodela intermedia]